MDGCFRDKLRLGLCVDVITKRDQRTGKLTRGTIRWILTSKDYHSRGIKVMLSDRTVGRVQAIVETNENEIHESPRTLDAE
ncbi:MAG: YwbE family protein [Bacteroidia bacterium]|jgi:uncharacterized repeat protein (TIGR03833 family)